MKLEIQSQKEQIFLELDFINIVGYVRSLKIRFIIFKVQKIMFGELERKKHMLFSKMT